MKLLILLLLTISALAQPYPDYDNSLFIDINKPDCLLWTSSERARHMIVP